MQRRKDRVAVVTGGASGIGAASAARLVAEGALVVIGDLFGDRAEALAAELGDAASAFAFDAEDTDSVKALIDAAVERHGRLDILHNNAALVDPALQSQDTTAVEIPFEVWDRTMAVNVRGYLAGCKYAIPHMIETGGGAIINTASGSGLYGDIARVAYGASKAAIMQLTRTVATQYGAQGIRCNAIAPGLIVTPGLRANAGELLAMMQRHILTPRLGEPEDIAAAVAYLVSDEAGYITGETLAINGGANAHHPHTVEFA